MLLCDWLECRTAGCKASPQTPSFLCRSGYGHAQLCIPYGSAGTQDVGEVKSVVTASKTGQGHSSTVRQVDSSIARILWYLRGGVGG